MALFELEYWENLFKNNRLAWDLGYPSPALTEYFDQISDKDIRILVPGAGNGYEVEYLYKNGFKNVFFLDFSSEAVKSFKKRCPDFPDEQIIIQDFFEYNFKFDLIVEQTFFTSFEPRKRKMFVEQMFFLLKENGKYMGLFFNHEFNKSYPPFGAKKEEYYSLFSEFFDFLIFDVAYNSIKPRKSRELFFVFRKKEK